jgi:pimeloyl-ACP methyl ester carboxylesterase
MPLAAAAGSPALEHPADLSGTGARLIEGVAADGVARAVLRIPTSSAHIVVSVCPRKLARDCGSASAEEYGALATLDDLMKDLSEAGGLTRRTIHVAPVATGGLQEAFVVYRSPVDFVRKARSSNNEASSAIASSDCPSGYEANDCAHTSRDVFLKIDAGGAPRWIDVKIVRPPVVLIHGLWASANDLGDLAQLEHDRRFAAVAINYGMKVSLQRSDPPVNWVKPIINAVTGSSLGIKYGSDVTAKSITERILPNVRQGRNGGPAIAAAQVDIVGHSLGAVVARAVAIASVSKGIYGTGVVHKIVSIAGPHRGSPLATQLILEQNQCMRDELAWAGLYVFGNRPDAVEALTPSGTYKSTGAMGDLAGDSDGKYVSPAIGQLANVPQRTPIAYVAGRMSAEQIQRDIVRSIVVSPNESRVVGGISHGVKGPSAEGVEERPINNVQELRLRCPHDWLAPAFASPANFMRLLSGASDGVVPLVSQLDRTSPANADILDGVVHSPGTGALYNVGGRKEKSLLDDPRILPIVKSLLNMASGDSRRYH